MGISTVSGPFRSKNGFQELVNGEWVSVAGGGGGGGNPNDIVVTSELTQASDYYCIAPELYGYYSIDLGVTMQTIQDSINSGGKWACFSGFEAVFYVQTGPSVTADAAYYKIVRGYSCQLLGEVYQCDAFYRARLSSNVSCTSFNTQTFGAGVNCYGCNSLGAPYILTPFIQSGYDDGVVNLPGNSLSCPALISVCITNVQRCSTPLPYVKNIVTLKFDAFPVTP